jgi:hypothetical protein
VQRRPREGSARSGDDETKVRAECLLETIFKISGKGNNIAHFSFLRTALYNCRIYYKDGIDKSDGSSTRSDWIGKTTRKWNTLFFCKTLAKLADPTDLATHNCLPTVLSSLIYPPKVLLHFRIGDQSLHITLSRELSTIFSRLSFVWTRLHTHTHTRTQCFAASSL